MTDQAHVLILQGGGALGAYQAGVYQQLQAHDYPIDWVIGTSIGAINAAIIAGNPPERRVARLEAFWHSLAPHSYGDMTPFSNAWLPWAMAERFMNQFSVLVNGVQGFFQPRVGAGWDLSAKVPLSQTGFYDTAPLKATLQEFVDFDYLNRGPMRVSVCAVDIDTGQSKIFDSSKQPLRVEHIMASGALPPGFPPVEIDGRAYWDGGVYSNSPLEVFLSDTANRDALCFMVDLWDPSEPRPTSIADAMARYKSIQYASRSKDELATHQKIQKLRRAIRIMADHLPEAERNGKDMQELIRLGRDHTVNVVHLVMKALPGEQYLRDIDFSRASIDKRWQAGKHDCDRALRHASWLRPVPPHAGLIIHELPQE